MTARLARQEQVFVLDLGDGENRFTPDWLTSVEQALTEVEGTEGPRALITVARGKTWSQGLDLEWLTTHQEQAGEYVGRVHALFARVLVLPVPTVAAVQGHCFAAGAMLALAHDWTVMRVDRGYWCLPEVDISIPFTFGMSALLQAKLTPAAATEAMTTGHRFGGTHAATAGLVMAAVAEQDVLSTAAAKVLPLVEKAGPTLGTIKERMYAPVVAALLAD